jgi:fructose-1,6-bisphosphatase-3
MSMAQWRKCDVPDAIDELFVSDVHGEFEEFAHLLRSACGIVRKRIDVLFGDMAEARRAELATLVCYPRQKMELMQAANRSTWLTETSGKLAMLGSSFAHERTAGQVRSAPPSSFAGEIADMLSLDGSDALRQAEEVATTLDESQARAFIVALCATVQRLAVGRVHMVGDVYDRGPSPDLVMDELATLPELDIQWGNHDMLWMGAALGQRGCVANAVRICARYGNLDVLEGVYGIDLTPLRNFARSAYADDPCAAFSCKGTPDLAPEELAETVKVQKAMAYLQFKVEHQLIVENPSFELQGRDLLHRIDYEAGTVELDGVVHELSDKVFPTIDPADPYRMTPEEEAVMDYLQRAFAGCERLQRHIKLFLERGSLYKICGNTLLFHACVPLNPDGTCKQVQVFGRTLSGRALFDAVDGYVRDAFTATDPDERKRGLDFLWYLWLGAGSPLFAKSKMATFELYLIADKAARKEVKNPFYSLLEEERVVDGIFREFGMDPKKSRIVCGHVPVRVKDGEDPVKCGGRVLIIDGGMSKAYQPTSGVAGFALVDGPQDAMLATFQTFCGTRAAIETDEDLHATWREV